MGNQNERQQVEKAQELLNGPAPRDSRSKIVTSAVPRDSHSYYTYKIYNVNQNNEGNKREVYVQGGNSGVQGTQAYYQETHYCTGGPQDTLRRENYSGGYGGNAYYTVQERYGIENGPTYTQQKNYYTQNVERIPTHMNFEASSVDRIREGRKFGREVYNTTDAEEYQEIPVNYYRGGYETIEGGRGVNIIRIGRGGIDSGSYKFEGARYGLREKTEIPRENNIMIEEEEIQKEINRRKRKTGPSKKTYELIDKFYAVTEVDAKSVRRRMKEEQFEEDRKYQLRTGGNKSFGYETGYTKMQMYGGQRDGGYGYSQSQMRGQKEGNYSYSESHLHGQQGGYGSGYRYEYSEAQMRGQGGRMNKNFSYGASYQNRSNYPTDNFSRYIFEQINKIRTNPQSFIGAIEDGKANITRDRHGRLIYKSKKVKVALANGESAFDEAVEFLNNSAPMEKLVFSSEITVDPPQYENDIKDRNDIRRKVEYMTENGINIKAYWRDIIKDPEISFLLMIVDDTGSKSGLKRKDILDPDMKYIGISSTEINGKFVCYMTFSPEL